MTEVDKVSFDCDLLMDQRTVILQSHREARVQPIK
jgi:hypothetical protein